MPLKVGSYPPYAFGNLRAAQTHKMNPPPHHLFVSNHRVAGSQAEGDEGLAEKGRHSGAQQHWYPSLCTERLPVPRAWGSLETLGQALRVRYSYSEGSEDTQHRRDRVRGLGLQMEQWL